MSGRGGVKGVVNALVTGGDASRLRSLADDPRPAGSDAFAGAYESLRRLGADAQIVFLCGPEHPPRSLYEQFVRVPLPTYGLVEVDSLGGEVSVRHVKCRDGLPTAYVSYVNALVGVGGYVDDGPSKGWRVDGVPKRAYRRLRRKVRVRCVVRLSKKLLAEFGAR